MKDGCFIIVGAGDIGEGDLPVKRSQGDFLCAADAGYRHLNAAGQQPDLLIGDFDSMEEPTSDSPPKIILPTVKDDTDTGYAVREGFRMGYRRFRIYGGVGGARLSHTIANIQLLSWIRENGGEAELISGSTRLFIRSAGQIERFDAPGDGSVSLFSLSEDSEISIRGLFYPLDHGKLKRTWPLGVSNHFTGDPAEITVHSGEILIILEEESHVPA